MGNKRLTIQRVDQFIRLLGATERVNGYAEQQKQHAVDQHIIICHFQKNK